MLLIIPIIYGVIAAAGATIGAIAAHAAGEKDRSEAQYHRRIANQLSEERDKLEKKFIDISEKSKKEIRALTKQAALNETEKDLLRVCVLMHQELISLMVDIDKSPNYSVLVKLQEAVISTNMVLSQLRLSTIPISPDYFERNYRRALLDSGVATEENFLESEQALNESLNHYDKILDDSGDSHNKYREIEEDVYPYQEVSDNIDNLNQEPIEQLSSSLRDQRLNRLIKHFKNVPGMTPAHKRDYSRSVIIYKFSDGLTLRTWDNMVGVDHIFIGDHNSECIYSGFVGWIHSDGLKEAIETAKFL